MSCCDTNVLRQSANKSTDLKLKNGYVSYFLIILMTTNLKPLQLVMVTGENNNKYYNMFPDGNEFYAEWGRVGVTKTVTRYPIGKWSAQYNSKLKKGYKDVTDLRKVTTTTKSGFAKITEPKIDALFAKLQGFSKTSVSENYTISSDAVTQAQVKEAQALMNDLPKFAVIGTPKNAINSLLLDLYAVIPRRMAKVQHHLAEGDIVTADQLQRIRDIIDSEQKTLDVMAGQVALQDVGPVTDDTTQKTLLDALGISVDLATDADIAIVRKLMADRAKELRNVYRVVHHDSQNLYQKNFNAAADKKSEIFWHGSRNENWMSILRTGLKIRPTNAVHNGSMFGDGIYFADKYQKSAGYTSLSGARWTGGNSNTGFLAVMDVHVGKQLHVTRHSHECYKYSRSYLSTKGGYDSVFAKGGYDLINNEYIVYSDSQSTIKYLIEVSR